MCGDSTRVAAGELQFGTMYATWGEGSSHSGEDYELHQCENCFFIQVSTMQRTRWVSVMFEDEGDAILADEAYGRVTKAARDSHGEGS